MRTSALAALFAAAAGWTLLTAGCASAPPPEAWTMEGSRIIGCCCSAPCPCRINKKPQHCHGCDGTTAVHLDRAHIGDVRLDGIDFVVTNRGFGEDPSKNWMYVYVTERASEAQFGALKAMIEEQVKAYGPVKVKHLIGTYAGIRKVPIAYARSADGREVTVSIPGILDFRARAIVLPGHKEPVVSTGIFDDYGDRLVHAEPLVHKYHDAKAGYAFDLTGRQANLADFVLTASRAERGGIGWGCYSGHSDLGDKSKYAEQLGGEDPK